MEFLGRGRKLRILDCSREEKNGHFQDLVSEVLEFLLKTRGSQMVSQNFSENSLDDVISGCVHGDGGEIPLETEIDSERA